MTKSEKAELLKLVHKCALLVCEARNFLEELEQMAIEFEDDTLEANAYDWRSAVETVESELDDYLAEQVE
jgi:hypothetical protein